MQNINNKIFDRSESNLNEFFCRFVNIRNRFLMTVPICNRKDIDVPHRLRKHILHSRRRCVDKYAIQARITFSKNLRHRRSRCRAVSFIRVSSAGSTELALSSSKAFLFVL